MTQINGKIFCAHGLEDLILLICPYYPKQSTDSLQSLSKFNGNFHRYWRNNPKICMEPQNTPHSQSNIEKWEKSLEGHISWFQTILHSKVTKTTVLV